MTKKIEISKIILKIGETNLELTLDEAKEIKKALDGLFTQTIEYVPYYSQYPYIQSPLIGTTYPSAVVNDDILKGSTTSDIIMFTENDSVTITNIKED